MPSHTDAHASQEIFHSSLQSLVTDRFTSRLFWKDASLWGEAAEDEAAKRLGWTDFSEAAARVVAEASSLKSEFDELGINRIVVCGMGGSSLAPGVLARWGGADLTVLDSTHPDAVRRALDASLLPSTAVVVSSKSGGTIETLSHLAAFEAAFTAAGIEAASRIVIVTDPGSPLETDSRAAGRHVFLADPQVGGRFSALTAFGLVPAVLSGVDVAPLLTEAAETRAMLASDDEHNEALQLAAALFAELPERYLLEMREPATAQWGLGAWIEQLVAESTGKQGHGVLPIALGADDALRDPPLPGSISVALSYGEAELDAELQRSKLHIAAPLGSQFLLWEVATAALGRLIGINPFDQPDVEAAKVAARAALAARATQPEANADNTTVHRNESAVADPTKLVAKLRDIAHPGEYLAIQAYVDPEGPSAGALHDLRRTASVELGIPVALGFGPSLLHSVGQLHKGGPRTGIFLQVIDTPQHDLEIPGSTATFGQLIAAQAEGDRNVLEAGGRTVLTLRIDAPSAIVAVAEELQQA